MADPHQRALQELWRKRLLEMKLRLDSASLQVREVRRTLGGIPSADGSYAFRQALREERLALAEYGRVLMILRDVMNGKNSDESDWPSESDGSSSRGLP